MRLLAFDSSCERASVALNLGGETRLRWLEGHANHSKHMLAAVRALLDEAGLGVGELDAIAFGTGPGAFTGLRLACGVAQGLALGAGLGVIPVCSLAAMSIQSPLPQVLVAIDARMGEIYFASYQVESGTSTVVEVVAPACCAPAALPCPGAFFGMGSAFAVYEAELAAVRARLSGCDPLAIPSAANVARLAAKWPENIIPAERAVPLYVRNKVAFTTAERQARGNRA